jgi:hypothetical protein
VRRAGLVGIALLSTAASAADGKPVFDVLSEAEMARHREMARNTRRIATGAR